MVESPFEVQSGGQTSWLRLVIVTLKDGHIQILDVAVAYETENSLKEVAIDKRRKYSIMEDTLISRFHGESFSFFPIVIGSRGTPSPWLRKVV